MTNSEALKFLTDLGSEIFGDDFKAVGCGGSFIEKTCPRDYDLILIIRKVEVPKMIMYMRKARRKLGKVDINIFTPLMWHEKLYGDKVATMLYKGVIFSDGRIVVVKREELPYYMNQSLLIEVLQKYLRALADETKTETRVIDLLIQNIVLSR